MKPYLPSRKNPWNAEQINLVYRRLGFGCSLSEIDLYLNSSPGVLIDDIVDGASSIDVTPAPEWSQWFSAVPMQTIDTPVEIGPDHGNAWLRTVTSIP